jgi:hypothetical protein
MTRRTLWLLLALAVPLAAAGCGASGTSPSSSSGPSSGSPSSGSSPTSGPSPSSASSPTGSPAPAGNALLVRYVRQGGFAGFSDSLTVTEDGHYTITRAKPPVQRSGQLSAADLAELRRVLADSGFAQLPKVQGAKGADLFSYQVTYRDSQILAQDGGIVPQLQPVISTLSGIVARYSG